MARPALLTALGLTLALTLPADAAKPVFTIHDPAGDAFGDGTFVYPETYDLDIQPEDLDLVELRAYATKSGTEFEAVFARPIKKPVRRPIESGVMLTDLAKLGFFTFNIDIYIDIDREPGSGRLVMLPGRTAEVHPDFAWEKVVCLTPRPDIARSELKRFMVADAKRELKAEKGSVDRDDVAAAKEQIALDVADDVFFPTQVRVQGRSVRFTVPWTFLRGETASPDWAYVIAVSAADVTADLQTRTVETGFLEKEFTGLFIVPVQAGGSRYTFGSSSPDTEMLPPLADIVVPEGASQEQVLRGYDVLADRPARLPGVVPGS